MSSLWVVVALVLLLQAVISESAIRGATESLPLTPYDPTLKITVHEYAEKEARQQFTVFPRRQVPQVRQIYQPGAVLMAVNIREIALLPGDRVVIRNPSNSTQVAIAASNQSVARQMRPRSILWNHPFLTLGNRVVIEYWPSLTTLVLPIDRKQMDNAVLVVDSYTYGFLPWRRSRRSDEDCADCVGESEPLESTIGARNEMKPAICYKTSQPKWYSKARSVARLMIQRPLNRPRLPDSMSGSDGTVGSEDAHDEQSDNPAGTGSWTFCTGWLVGRGNHMLTNYHCFFELTGRSRGPIPRAQASMLRRQNLTNASSIPSAVPSVDQSTSTSGDSDGRGASYLTQATVNFMAESKTCNVTGTTGERAGEIDATRVAIVAASESLDYCLLRLIPSSDSSRSEDLAKKFGYLTLRESGPVDGEAIYIPQHPNGEPKTIASVKDGKPATIRMANSSLRDDTSDGIVGDVDLSFANGSVWYNADTAPGSSGSPVISQRDNVVVALHHAGTGMRGGALGQPSGWYSSLVDYMFGSISNDTRGESEYNAGIRINAIVADMRKRGVLPPCAVAEKCELTNGKIKSKSTKPTAHSACCENTW